MDLFLNARFRKYFLIIFLIILIGTTGLVVIEDYSVLNAFFMTLITITTIGYGEIQPLDTEGRIFMSILIIGSFGTFAFAVTQVTNYVLSGEYRHDVLMKKKFKSLSLMKDHVIVCGYGKVGKQAVERLRLFGRKTVVIEKDPELISMDESGNLIFIEGDATNDEVLKEAGIDQASSLIATAHSDADNLFIVVSAKALNPRLQIISRATDPSAVQKIRNAGAQQVIMPYTVGGLHLAQLIVQPDLTEFLDVISQQSADGVNLEEVLYSSLPDNIQFKTIGQLNASRVTGCTVIGFKRSNGEVEINPSPEAELQPDSKLFVLGTRDQIKRLNAILKNQG